MNSDQVIDDWFGQLDADEMAPKEKVGRWFKKDAAFDDTLRRTYGAHIQLALEGKLDDWASSATGTLALILLLDQFTRNVFRDTGEMYSGDERAAALSKQLISEGADQALPTAFRCFVYMPLMHSEQLADQDLCVEQFFKLSEECVGPARKGVVANHDYAIKHRDIVARFGRFPHRNELLGRSSTPEELEFLKQPGSAF